MNDETYTYLQDAYTKLMDKYEKLGDKYQKLLKFVKILSNSSCDLIGDCKACDALDLLREIGEDK